MGILEVTAERDEDIWALIKDSQANRPEYLYNPEFRTNADQSVTAILHCNINTDYEAPVEEVAVEEVAVEVTCEAKILGLGKICGRNLPCRYHK